jgi:hypothetical protein
VDVCVRGVLGKRGCHLCLLAVCVNGWDGLVLRRVSILRVYVCMSFCLFALHPSSDGCLSSIAPHRAVAYVHTHTHTHTLRRRVYQVRSRAALCLRVGSCRVVSCLHVCVRVEQHTLLTYPNLPC